MTKLTPRKSHEKSAAQFSLHLQYFEPRKKEIVQTIRQLVEIESPSDNKPAVDRLTAVIAAKFATL